MKERERERESERERASARGSSAGGDVTGGLPEVCWTLGLQEPNQLCSPSAGWAVPHLALIFFVVWLLRCTIGFGEVVVVRGSGFCRRPVGFQRS